MKRILVPVDGSDTGNKAAQFGAMLAKKTGAELTLLYVYDTPRIANMGLIALSDEDVDRARDKMAREVFEGSEKAIARSDIKADHEVSTGNPTVEILAVARELTPDLIVVGSRGFSSVEGLILGSVSERVLRSAPCPVTVVR